MDYAHLGRSGLPVTRLCLGTMNFGPETTEEDSLRDHGSRPRARHQLLRHRQRLRLEEGRGLTEQIIGRWFAQGGGRRERTVLATKVYGSMSDWPNDTCLSARNIRLACDASLQAAADRLHRPLPDAPRRPGHALGRDLAGDGDAAHAGQGALRRLDQLRRLAPRPGAGRPRGARLLGLVSEQWIYNLLKRDVELEVLPACQDYGLGVIPWSPLHGGLLGGMMRKAGRASGG